MARSEGVTITCSAHRVQGSVLEFVVIAQPQLFEAELRVDAQRGERDFGGGGVQMVPDVHTALFLQATHDGLVCTAQRRVERHVRAQTVLSTCGAVGA